MNIGRLTAVLATTSCLVAWALLARSAFEEAQLRCRANPRAYLGCRDASLLELHGIPPAIFVVAAAYGVAALGGLLVWRGIRTGRWLMAAALVPLVGVGLVSSGLVFLMPITCAMVLATITSFAGEGA